jgi:uncharacterized membrane protein
MPRTSPARRWRRPLAIAASIAMLSTMTLGAQAAASEQAAAAKKYQACWYFTDDKDNTITCKNGFRAPIAKVVLDGTCWQFQVDGAYAQEKVKGGWVDRRDIPLVWKDEPFCPTDTPVSSVITVPIPVANFTLHTYRVAIPETDRYQASFGNPMTACVRWSKNARYCGD